MNVLRDPDVWPGCQKCGTAYVFRRAMKATGGWCWVWQSECQCRPSTAVLRDADGVYVPETETDAEQAGKVVGNDR